MKAMLGPFFAIIRRDLRLAYQGGGAGLALLFFLIAAMLLAFGLGPNAAMLSAAARGYLWVAALLAVLLTLERIYQADLEEGVLDWISAVLGPSGFFALAKILAHFLAVGLPLSLLAPVGGLLLGLPIEALWPLALSFLCGLPGLSATGALMAALTAGLKRGGLLNALLSLPACVPFAIFGPAAAGGSAGFGAAEGLLFLAAASLIAVAAAIALIPRALAAQLE